MSKTAPGHIHREAFLLMTYASDDGRVVERVWNSRNGVTPFLIRSRDGIMLTHVRWNEDRFVPDYRPQPGERIFVDMTRDRARILAERKVEEWLNGPDPILMTTIFEHFPSHDDAVLFYTEHYFGDGGQPDLIDATDWNGAG